MKKLLIFGLFLAVVLSFVPMLSYAQEGLVPCGGCAQLDVDTGQCLVQQPTCGLCHLFQLINNIVNWVLLVIIPVIAPIFLVIGGIYLLIARGDPAMFKKGSDILTATVVGLIIIYAAWVLLSTVLTFLGVADWTGLGTWWKIACPI